MNRKGIIFALGFVVTLIIICSTLAVADIFDSFERRVATLEQEQENLCDVIERVAETDQYLVTLIDSPDEWMVRKTNSKIYAASAYCRNAIAVYVDIEPDSDFKVRLIGSDFENWAQFSIWEGLDPTITLLDAGGEEIVSFDPSPYLRRGDFVYIGFWNFEEPPNTIFFDPETSFWVNIDHLGGRLVIADSD